MSQFELIEVVAQAPYPVCVTNGRHFAPGEFGETERTPEVESLLTLGLLREVIRNLPPEIPAVEEVKEPSRKPRAVAAPDPDQED